MKKPFARPTHRPPTRTTDDAKLGARLFALDADYVDSLGHLSKGRSEIEHEFQELFAGLFQRTTCDGHIESNRFLMPTMTLVDITFNSQGVFP
jgi:uncharacterized protein (TIGR02246 family)